MNKRAKIFIVAGSLIGCLVIIVGLVLVSARNNEKSTSTPVPARLVTRGELNDGTGVDGKACLVAVDGIVYEISNSLYWKEGKHTTSEGQAYCGADMSEMIKRSPHGKTTLSRMTKIGTLTQ